VFSVVKKNLCGEKNLRAEKNSVPLCVLRGEKNPSMLKKRK
jgi:hypothetical protein